MRERIKIASLGLSAAALIGLLAHEGYREKAYPDPTYGTKVPTVGFGTTGKDITMQTTMAPVPAMQRALRDIQKFDGHLKECVKVPLSQGEYDIYLRMLYNTGPGKAGVKDGFCWRKKGGYSGLVTELNAGNYREACDQILRWRYSNGQDCSAPGNRTCSGLWKRRQDEHAQCIAAVNAVEAPQ
ncbi:MAG: glycoside hydrolase family protein [Brachymonas sp.]